MNTNRSILVVALTLVVGACNPGTDYTAAEAPKNLKLDIAKSEIDVRFAPGSAVLAPADAARLRQLAAKGGIAAADRVMVAAAGPPGLAQLRVGSVSSVLVRYGIAVIAVQRAQVPPEHAAIEVTRTLVTLPACPNWSKPSNYDFGNQPSSNFGCATQSILGMMVAHPTDIASGLPLDGSSGQPTAAAVNRYLNDKVTALPASGTATAFSAAAGGGAPAANTPSTGSP
ncbi:MAG TPA: CpaD family pilus assembly lipoprotein [Stellaceae bacterium]|nr:CpaD family pilus assembly lipoprotein [Stellaceae bacterium]